MPSAKAIVNPNFLRWARNRRGYDINEAARKIGVKEQKLMAAEEGDDYITINQLIKAANIYKRPVTAFYLKTIPKDFEFPDFRGKEVDYDGDLNIIIREFKEQKDESSNFYNQLNYNYNYEFVGSAKPIDSLSNLVNKVEQWIPLKREEILQLKDNTALNYWKKIMEDLGIIIFQFGGVDLEVTRGFSFSKPPFPLIALNKNDSFYARIFTIIHEFIHILFDQEGICGTQRQFHDQINIEKVCNEVATEYLLPSSLVEGKVPDRFISIDDILSTMIRKS